MRQYKLSFDEAADAARPDEAEQILQGLNPAQQEAVRVTDGPVLIIAGPGSGKTRTLTHRIAYLIAAGKARPFEILALTFTNKAAREMKERIERLVGPEQARGMWMGTFHATFARLLRIEGERIGYTPDFSIYDPDDSQRILRELMDRYHVDGKQFNVRMMHALISSAKNRLVAPGEYARLAATPAQEKAALLYGPYQEALRKANAMDFDDLSAQAHRAVPAARRRAGEVPEPLALSPHRRVPGHQPRAVRAGEAAGRPPQEPVRGGRRRAEHLRLPRGRHHQYPLVPAGLPRSENRPPRTELPLHEDHPPPGRRHHPPQPGPAREVALDGKQRRRAGDAAGGHLGAGRGAEGGTHHPRPARAPGLYLPRLRRALPDQRAEPFAGGGAPPGRPPVPRRRRRLVLPAPRDQGRAGLPAPGRQPERRGQPAPRHQLPHARHRGQDAGGPLRLRPARGPGHLAGPRARRGGRDCPPAP
ncbi:MAG: hypothetical protein KatS3mg043_0421 [Rhodothermaceae bacterium]|nr:MAG: hypothetical protein KatS3mg043_0421 [Rhodothermaceae bacterium]